MKHQIEILTILLMFAVILLTGCSGCSVKTAHESLDSAPDHDQHVHTHQDGLHPSHHTAYTQVPEAPAGDDFFKTIQFPTTPPKLDHGHHYVPPKNPYAVPDYVKKNPDYFTVDKRGFWEVQFSEEKLKILDKYSAADVQANDFIIEELDTLTAAEVIGRHGLHPKIANKLLDQAYSENPDGFYELLYRSQGQSKNNPNEAEAGFRRLVELYPESKRALYNFAVFIIDHVDKPKEAIPYLEKVYHMDPNWYAPILMLGKAYFKLEQFDKSLIYFQASEVFTGGSSDVSAIYIGAIKRHLNKGQHKKGE